MSESDKFWDKSAEKYSKSQISDEATYNKKLAETQQYFKPEMHVVEFGCGTGSTAIVHAPYVHHIDATDVSENMLEIGRGKALKAGINNITFTRGTLAEFNAKDASVDAVLGLNVLHLLPDWQANLLEVKRILKPGGIFVSSTACLGNSWMRHIILIAPVAKKLGLMPDVVVLKEAELANEVKNAGFKIESQWNHGSPVKSVFMVARKDSTV